jgi:DNA-binding response OmpR family regulator
MSPTSGPLRLAVIDTDSGFLRVLAKRLGGAGWEYRIFSGPVPADELAVMKLNAILIDLTVMEPFGWDFLERICGMMPGLGIVVCTQGGTVAQRVRGLRLGADDWVNKPCHPEEVIARLEAVVRRHRRGEARGDVGPVVAGELEIRGDQFEAYVATKPLGLTRREFELLQTLAEASGRVLEREDIYQRVWGYAMAHGDRSVDVFVRKLRSKLQQHSPGWGYIHTHFGIGYRFEAESLSPEAADVAISGSDPKSLEGTELARRSGPDPAEAPAETPATTRS